MKAWLHSGRGVPHGWRCRRSAHSWVDAGSNVLASSVYRTHWSYAHRATLRACFGVGILAFADIREMGLRAAVMR